jgi:hypothetical protein
MNNFRDLLDKTIFSIRMEEDNILLIKCSDKTEYRIIAKGVYNECLERFGDEIETWLELEEIKNDKNNN